MKRIIISTKAKNQRRSHPSICINKYILLRTILAEESRALAEFHAESFCLDHCLCAGILHLRIDGLVFEYFELRF